MVYGGKPHVAKRGAVGRRLRLVAHARRAALDRHRRRRRRLRPVLARSDNSLVEIGTVDLHIIVPKGLVGAVQRPPAGCPPDRRRPHPKNHWRSLKHPNNYAIAPQHRAVQAHSPRPPTAAASATSFRSIIWYLPGQDAQARELFAEFAPTHRLLRSQYRPLPILGDEKVGVVETPHLGMEHQTINAYGNAYKKAPEGFDWLFQHEFSHEWFGNQLTNPRLGRHVAARRLRHLHAAALHRSGAAARCPTTPLSVEAALANPQHPPGGQRPPPSRGPGL